MADTKNTSIPYQTLQGDFVSEAKAAFQATETEISQRNQKITERDEYIYGDRIERALKVPIGHDSTPVNWLRRTVEIHKNMHMSRGFSVVSTYDSQDSSAASDEQDEARIEVENQKQKAHAEQRMSLIEAIKRDNGGDAFWANLAENASAAGVSAVKMYWDDDEKKVEVCEVESVENLYAIWSRDDFRKVQAYAYIYQVTKEVAIKEYGAPENVATSPLGHPFDSIASSGSSIFPQPMGSTPMVTIMEATGIMPGWGSEKGRVKRVDSGKENAINVKILGDEVTQLIDDTKKLPKYYLFHNKRQRRRPWGMSDISDAAIQINLTYVETLSDWRTLASKVNFQKFKALGFPMDATIPKPEARKVEFIPLGEDQDIVPLQSGDSNSIDWQRQLDELKEQFVRETGISRVLFDDPSVTLNSNQALLTSMKPTSDIAEAKKQLWTPVLVDLFTDALELVAMHNPELKEIVDPEEDWSLKVMWPSVMQKEDPVYQSMLLNRLNAGTMSIQSYLEAQGESKEEIDRMRDEMNDPITAAILGKQLPLIAQTVVDATMAEIRATIFAAFPELNPQNEQGNQPGVNPNGGTAAQVSPDNQATGGVGMSPVSQPGTGATAASPAGVLAQANQNMGG